MSMWTKTTRLALATLCFLAVGAWAQRTKPTTIQSCNQTDCHDQFEMKEYLHGPIALGECTGCHKPDNPAEHTFKFAREGNDLCVNCHLEQTGGKHVHKPLTEGKCTQCHDPHSSDTKGLLVKETVAETCAQCHNVTDHEFLHGPAAVGECSICHNAHSSDEKKLLTMKPTDLCLACHEVTKNEIAKFEFVHEPAKGECAACHDPHGAKNRQMLKSDAPEMCITCHADVHKVATESKVKHDAVMTAGGCLQCHTPHASTVQHNLRKAPMDLCVDCHSKPVGGADNPVPSFTDQIKGKKFPHGPVQDKDCSGCHQTHGSDHFRLLTAEYPAVFYADFAEQNYALCFTCHQKTLVWTEKTEDLTNFRNGERNLHYLHVNKETRGRTCRACHETHASNQPKHIRESVPYGMWNLPLNFKKAETGGSCSPGCHIAKVYDRDKPVDYTAPRVKAATGAAQTQ
ncbi:MAG: cytochrome C [Phycisphaerae bacterium]|nr:cytochrome C [Phycisphaerae bacterium]